MNNGIKMFYDTALQKNASSGEGKSCPRHSDELNVTESQQYDSPAEREYAEQEKLKQWYESGTGYTVRKRKCIVCGKEFYTLNNFRKYCHLSGCQSKIEMSKRSVNTIQSIAVLSVVLLSFQRETMQNFAVTVADKKHTVKRISGKGTKCSLTS